MTQMQFLIASQFCLTLIVGYVLIIHYLDRACRAEAWAEIETAVTRCTTAEANCTRSESKAAEYAATVRASAANVQGWHDCIKPRPEDTVDYNPPKTDDGFRTGEYNPNDCERNGAM